MWTTMINMVTVVLVVISLSQAAPSSPQTIAIDEKSSYLEADILPDMVEQQESEIKRHLMKTPPPHTLMGLGDNERLWPGGNVAYKLDFDTSSNLNLFVTDTILSAIQEINNVGCVNIAPVSSADVNYVNFRLGANYSSYVGRQGGAQNLTVNPAVPDFGSVMHELMHALGFGHEHNRANRDQYVTVDFSNIKEEAHQYFTIYTPDSGFTGVVEEYDYTSIMHATGASDPQININTAKPVIWRNDGKTELGQRFKLTELDKLRLKLAYSCDVCVPPEHNELLFRFPGDCTKFIQCSNTFAYVMDCPPNLHYSISGNRCDYPSLANCTAQIPPTL